jgi:hypothetical protein
VLVIAGLYLVVVLEARGRRRGGAVLGMVLALGGLYVAALAVPAARRFFELSAPTAGMVLTAAAAAGVSIAALLAAGFAPGSGGAGPARSPELDP